MELTYETCGTRVQLVPRTDVHFPDLPRKRRRVTRVSTPWQSQGGNDLRFERYWFQVLGFSIVMFDPQLNPGLEWFSLFGSVPSCCSLLFGTRSLLSCAASSVQDNPMLFGQRHLLVRHAEVTTERRYLRPWALHEGWLFLWVTRTALIIRRVIMLMIAVMGRIWFITRVIMLMIVVMGRIWFLCQFYEGDWGKLGCETGFEFGQFGQARKRANARYILTE